MLHGRKEVSFVSIIMFILHPDALSLNGSVMITHAHSSSSREVYASRCCRPSSLPLLLHCLPCPSECLFAIRGIGLTVLIGLPAVVGPGDLLPSPKNAVRSFFMADLSFLGNSCSRLLCCFPLVVCASLMGVAVISPLLRAPFPSSIIQYFCSLWRRYLQV